MKNNTIKMEIKNIAGDVIYSSSTAETIKQAVEEAVNKGEDLSGADLEGAIIKP